MMQPSNQKALADNSTAQQVVETHQILSQQVIEEGKQVPQPDI